MDDGFQKLLTSINNQLKDVNKTLYTGNGKASLTEAVGQQGEHLSNVAKHLEKISKTQDALGKQVDEIKIENQKIGSKLSNVETKIYSCPVPKEFDDFKNDYNECKQNVETLLADKNKLDSRKESFIKGFMNNLTYVLLTTVFSIGGVVTLLKAWGVL